MSPKFPLFFPFHIYFTVPLLHLCKPSQSGLSDFFSKISNRDHGTDPFHSGFAPSWSLLKKRSIIYATSNCICQHWLLWHVEMSGWMEPYGQALVPPENGSRAKGLNLVRNISGKCCEVLPKIALRWLLPKKKRIGWSPEYLFLDWTISFWKVMFYLRSIRPGAHFASLWCDQFLSFFKNSTI